MTGRVGSRLFGAAVTTGLILYTVIAAALPLLGGLLVVSLVPGLGEMRGVGAWGILHVLWIIPVLYLVSSVIDAITETLWPTARVLRDGVGGLLLWAAMTLVLHVYFEHIVGAAVAAAVALVLYLVATPYFKRQAEMVGKRSDQGNQT